MKAMSKVIEYLLYKEDMHSKALGELFHIQHDPIRRIVENWGSSV